MNNSPSNSEECGEEQLGQSPDDDGQNLTTGRTETGNAGDIDPDQLDDRIVASDVVYHEPPRRPTRYCGIPVRFRSGICAVRVILTDGWTYVKRLRITLGKTEPCHINLITALIQDRARVNRIVPPWDELDLTELMRRFSPTITEYWPYPRTSIAVQDSEPCTMPMAISVHTGHRNQFNETENIHVNTNVTTRTDLEQTTTLHLQNDTHRQTVVEDNNFTQAPNEVPRDTDFSEELADPPLGNVSDPKILENERHPHPDDQLTDVDTKEGQASMHSEAVISNTENKTQPVQAAIPNQQSAASASTTDPPSPEVTEVVPSTDTPSEPIFQQTSPTIPTNMEGPKVEPGVNCDVQSTNIHST